MTPLLETRHSEGFNRYRGTRWMPDTCRSCDQHRRDHAGCHYQAYLVTGNPAATDPVCPKSPDRPRIDEVLAQTRPIRFQPAPTGLVFRSDAASRERSPAGE